MTRRGVTFVELMIVLTLVGILAAIAIPRLWDVRRSARAASAIADFNAIRVAAYDQYAKNGTYPPTAGWGQVPPELAESLPSGFSFQRADLTYRWRRWSLPNGMPQNPQQTELMAVEIQSQDGNLIGAIRNLFRGQTQGRGTQITLVIE